VTCTESHSYQISDWTAWRLDPDSIPDNLKKPASASNEAFLKGSVKQDASNQIQPQQIFVNHKHIFPEGKQMFLKQNNCFTI